RRHAKRTAAEARRLEVDLLDPRLVEQLADARAAGEPAILLVAQQDISGRAAICDDDRPLVGRALRPADILIELAARQGGDGHGRPPRILLLPCYAPSACCARQK